MSKYAINSNINRGLNSTKEAIMMTSLLNFSKQEHAPPSVQHMVIEKHAK